MLGIGVYPTVEIALAKAFGTPRGLYPLVLGIHEERGHDSLTASERIAQDAIVKQAIRRELQGRSLAVIRLLFCRNDLTVLTTDAHWLAQSLKDALRLSGHEVDYNSAMVMVMDWAHYKRVPPNHLARKMGVSVSTAYRRRAAAKRSLNEWRESAMAQARALMLERGWIEGDQ